MSSDKDTSHRVSKPFMDMTLIHNIGDVIRLDTIYLKVSYRKQIIRKIDINLLC